MFSQRQHFDATEHNKELHMGTRAHTSALFEQYFGSRDAERTFDQQIQEHQMQVQSLRLAKKADIEERKRKQEEGKETRRQVRQRREEAVTEE